jgi:4-diphosphocytidyl-2-C-methyl-D-erythritol kinase
MICFPNAKINLGLHVINKREDAFHNIETDFYPVGFSDMLEVVRNLGSGTRDNKVTFFSDGLKIDGRAADNLIVKAYALLDKDFSLEPVSFFLYKQIPMGAGLGGGSADAAFTIRMLNDLFSLQLTPERMKDYASQLGSDCAFFIDNKPAYVLGRGNELEPIALDLSGYFIAIIYPGIHSDTSLAYKHVQRREKVDESSSLKALIQEPAGYWKNKMENDFERSVFAALPPLAGIKQQLYDCGAVYASMSGSGSAIFGIFDREPVLPGELRKHHYFIGSM